MEVANHPSIWLHVDAAWAGLAFALPEYREKGQLPAVNRFADSFCTSFHKVGHRQFERSPKGLRNFQLGLTNIDCSAFWVRDRKSLNDAMDVSPEYLRTKQGDAGL